MENGGFVGDMRDSVCTYLGAAPQIEEVWQEINRRVAARIGQGMAPWDAYAEVSYALACIRAARTYLVLVSELLDADATANPQTASCLPQVTYEQAHALGQQIAPNLQRAVQSLNDEQYVPDVALPLQLEPHHEAGEMPYPLPHLQGMIAAASEVRGWATALLALYDNAISAAPTQVPSAITAHRSALQSLLAQADSQLRFGVDLLSEVKQGTMPPQAYAEAELSLWNSLQSFLLLNQAIAAPQVLDRQR